MSDLSVTIVCIVSSWMSSVNSGVGPDILPMALDALPMALGRHPLPCVWEDHVRNVEADPARARCRPLPSDGVELTRYTDSLTARLRRLSVMRETIATCVSSACGEPFRHAYMRGALAVILCKGGRAVNHMNGGHRTDVCATYSNSSLMTSRDGNRRSVRPGLGNAKQKRSDLLRRDVLNTWSRAHDHDRQRNIDSADHATAASATLPTTRRRRQSPIVEYPVGQHRPDDARPAPRLVHR